MPPTRRWIRARPVAAFTVGVAGMAHSYTLCDGRGTVGPVGGGHAPEAAVDPGEAGGSVHRWSAGMARSYTLCDGRG